MADNQGKSAEELKQQIEEKKEAIREKFGQETPEEAVEQLSKWRNSPDRPKNNPKP